MIHEIYTPRKVAASHARVLARDEHVREAHADVARGCTRRTSRRSTTGLPAVRGTFGSRAAAADRTCPARVRRTLCLENRTNRTFVRTYVAVGHLLPHRTIAPNMPRVSCLSGNNIAAAAPRRARFSLPRNSESKRR